MVKIDTSEVKKETILEIDGQLYRVIDFSFMQMQQRQGSYTFKVRNLITGGVQNITYKSGTMLEKGDVTTKNALYLYNSGDSYSFMENDSGEIYELAKETIEDVVPYLKENMDLFLMIYQGNVLNVILPKTITYTIKETVPGVKGDRSTAGKKPAILETGLEVNVPLHKEAGQTVVINTTTGEIA
jgi:elongation factor P